jgi:hypothetical protein
MVMTWGWFMALFYPNQTCNGKMGVIFGSTCLEVSDFRLVSRTEYANGWQTRTNF